MFIQLTKSTWGYAVSHHGPTLAAHRLYSAAISLF